MSSSNTLLLLLSLAVGVAGFIFGLLQRSRTLTQSNRLSELETQSRTHTRDVATLRSQLDTKLGEVKALEDTNRALKLQADTASRVAKEIAPSLPKADKKERSQDKAQEKSKVLEARTRDLEQQVAAEQRKAERLDRQVRQRDEDVRLLQLELQDVRQSLDALTSSKSSEPKEISDRPVAMLPPIKVQSEPEVAPAPRKVERVEVVQPPPSAPDAAMESLREELVGAHRSRSDAQARVNLLELEVRQLRDRVEKRETLFKELLGKVRQLNHDKLKAAKIADTYPRLYLGLKGRYDLALDLVHAFRTKYNEVLPMELDIEIGRSMEEYLAYAEQEDRSRPRSASRGGQDQMEGPASSSAASDAPSSAAAPAASHARSTRAPRKGNRSDKGSSAQSDSVEAAPTAAAPAAAAPAAAAPAAAAPTAPEFAETSSPLESFTDAITHAISDGFSEESSADAPKA